MKKMTMKKKSLIERIKKMDGVFIKEIKKETVHTANHPHTQDCGCQFTTTSLLLPEIVQNSIENWNHASDERVLEVKQAFVKLIPALGPVETLKMALGKDPHGTGFVARFMDRPFKEATIGNDKTTIWMLE
jgi:hypothetical protein